MVEVQKIKVFCNSVLARATLCGDRRGRGAKTRAFFSNFVLARALQGSAWSRCKNSRFFAILSLARATLCGDRRGRGAKFRGCLAISFWLARPSAGIGVVEVQKLEVFCNFVLARATLCADQRGRGAKTRGFLRLLFWLARPSAGISVVEVQKLEVFCGFCCSSWSSGVVAGSIPLRSAGGLRKLHGATCIKQLAQSNLHTLQLAQSNLRKATCNLRMCQAGAKQVCRASWGVMLSGHSSSRSLTQGVNEVAGSLGSSTRFHSVIRFCGQGVR